MPSIFYNKIVSNMNNTTTNNEGADSDTAIQLKAKPSVLSAAFYKRGATKPITDA